eukprot:Nitzschia sp. Nitz4//scaffold19_size178191//166306//167769//NITZ4_002012-RA/size178191-processed-gene-0.38-mRNA-1//1//CDS//3329540786//3406//frame0
MGEKVDEIRPRFEAAGQGHVFQYYDGLSEEEKGSLLKQLATIPVEKLDGYLKAALADQESLESSSEITPFSKPVGRTSNKEQADKAYQIGIDAISKGQVAALVLAGGQGTRLGFDGPKGMYDIGLLSGSTLFQLIAERILSLKKLASSSSEPSAKQPKLDLDSTIKSASAALPFYIMTSPINHDETVKYFEENKYFGLPADNVFFFQQGMLPCLTNEGKIILESASSVAMAPDGNGGIYPSLVESGMLADMEKRNIQHLHVFSIDNALTKPADPTFIGYCISQDADCGNKVVWKAGAHEKVGVIAEKDGNPCVVEYSDITKEMAERTDEEGRLVFGAGNICNHYYTIAFIKDVILPKLGNMYHIARKKIPYYDGESKSTVKPDANNGIKLETFIFDVFPFSQRMAVLDVLRQDEFAPVKNAPGSPTDSPDTALEYLTKLSKKWIINAGGTIKETEESSLGEVSPMTSYGGEGLEKYKGKEMECPFVI